MAPASNTVAGLRAEISQWKKQLNAERSASQQKVEERLTKNEAALSALKDEVISIRKSEQRSPRKTKPDTATQHKRQRVSSSGGSGSRNTDTTGPLDKDDILDHVFGWVGGGDYLYVAGVSRRWRGRYMQHCAHTTTGAHDKKLVTRYRSTIMSESRLQHAKATGFIISDLNLSTEKYALMICQHSLEPQQVITVLRLHGVPWNNIVCKKAAYLGNLHLLQWLHSNGCKWHEYSVLVNAGRSGSVPMLEWLRTVTKPWYKETSGDMLVDAASCGRMRAARWIKAQGASWPTSFVSKFTNSRKIEFRQCWSLSAVRWAVASGSGWLKWKCGNYAADKYDGEGYRKQATDVLQWAHANGCPCTCGPNQQQQQQ
jgi:hypothetical protein